MSGEPDGTADQGDPVCWLHRLCEECGAMPSPDVPDRCWRCGAPLAEEHTGGPGRAPKE